MKYIPIPHNSVYPLILDLDNAMEDYLLSPEWLNRRRSEESLWQRAHRIAREQQESDGA
jgi:hypothetical protein